VLMAAFGHGSSDFPHLFANVGNKLLQTYFAEVTPIYPRISRKGQSRDFKQTDLVTMGKLPSLLLTPEGAPLKEASFSERKEQVRVYTYGRKFSISREAMINDDLDGIAQQLQTWGMVARRTPDILLITILTTNPTMADGVALFHADHGNLDASPDNLALSVPAMKVAVTKFKRKKSFGERTEQQVPIQVDPKVLLVPSELWDVALLCTTAVVDPTGKHSAVPNTVQRLGIDPIDTPLLSDDEEWYLLGDPSLAPALQVNFLNGNENPIVTPVGNGSIRGQEYEIIYDVGAKAVNYESIYKNEGDAQPSPE
jgi:hypothetical protein